MPAHPTAIIDPAAHVDPTAEVGPYSLIHADVTVGPECVIGPYCVLLPGTRLGARNTLHASVSFGDRPQSVDFDPSIESTVEIGDDNTFREYVTVHRAETAGGVTRIGNHNFFMVNSHVGHDCVIADHAIVAGGALVAGHAHLDDHVFLSGNAMVHQFVRIGRLGFLRGGAGVSLDVPPFAMADRPNILRGLNVVGLRRAGISAASRKAVARAYKTLFYKDLNITQALEEFDGESQDPLVDEVLAFIRASERGVIRANRAGSARSADAQDVSDEADG